MANLFDLRSLIQSILEVFQKIENKKSISLTPIHIYERDLSFNDAELDKIYEAEEINRIRIVEEIDHIKILDFDIRELIKNLLLTIKLINELQNSTNKTNSINIIELNRNASRFLKISSFNYSSLNNFLIKIEGYNSNEIRNIDISRRRINANFISGKVSKLSMDFYATELFCENEKLIKNLTNSLTDIFINHERIDVNENILNLKKYEKNGTFNFLNIIEYKKDNYIDLINKLEKNNHEITEFEKKNIVFQKVLEQYTHAKNELDKKQKEISSILFKSSTELNTFMEMSTAITDEFNTIDSKKEEIHTAIKSLIEINKIGDESKKINNFMSERKKELYEILDDAKNTIKILSGSSIAKHLDKQEKKEALAAKGWLFLSGILLIASLWFTSYGFDKNKLDWNFFIFKILTLPILFSSLIFSMRQYVKRKNIVDSYSYKKTLALSLTGFKKQIDKTSDESQLNYILKTIEILTESPLNDLEKNHIKNELESLDKIRESVIENAISTIKNQQNNPKDIDN